MYVAQSKKRRPETIDADGHKGIWIAGDGRADILMRSDWPVAALRVSYSNRTHGDFARRVITVEAIDGPFRLLRVVWRFTPRADHRTRIDFSADFEFSSLVLAAVASRFLDSMFGEMVDAFERRADHLFGRDET